MQELYTDNTNDDDNAFTTNDDDDANDIRWTNHDCIGSLPNEPKMVSVSVCVHASVCICVCVVCQILN